MELAVVEGDISNATRPSNTQPSRYRLCNFDA
jgi:hypothetical protein